jgi:hypothetical protein
MRKLRLNNTNRNACTDSPNDPSNIKTYKLIFEYAVTSWGAQTPEDFETIITAINNTYNSRGIYFLYYFFPVRCDDCLEYDSPGWGRENPINNTIDFQDCIWARIPELPFEVEGGRIAGTGDFKNGRFWSIPEPRIIIHELGHALGLLHTFSGFSAIKSEQNEYINQISDSSCGCNCKFRGDFICDTPVNPYDLTTQNWATEMFGQLSNPQIINAGNKSDFCNTSYSVLNSDTDLVLKNVMSYFPNSYNISDGQASFIKQYNIGKPWEINGPATGGGSMHPGFVVSQPMVITSPLNITGDIEVRSKLTILNTSISFMQNKKLIIKPGGELILDNGHLKTYDGEGCFPYSPKWEGIEAFGPGLIKITLKNGSTISKAIVGIYAKNATLLTTISSGSKINCLFNTALDISNGLGKINVTDSNLNGVIKINDFWNGITLSNSNVNVPKILDPKGGAAKGIIIWNASLNIKNQSAINASIDISNMGTQNVNFNSSFFYDRVMVSKNNGNMVIRDNQFTFKYEAGTSSNSLLFLKNVSKVDLYKNIISNHHGVKFEGFVASAPLIFKNQIQGDSTNYLNDQSGSNARIECNTLISNLSNLKLLQTINKSQGNKNLAAGNYFLSYFAIPNISYFDSPQIDYFFHRTGNQEPSITGSITKTEALQSSLSTCSLPYPNTPPFPQHCYNGNKDGNETGVDCGGSCPKCPFTPDPNITITPEPIACTNGVQDQGETGIDCGGPCKPCFSTCNNGVQDSGEYGMDCGGICPPCDDHIPSSCTDGIMNGIETGVDCGGPSCAPCITLYCHNGIQDHGETDIDCGGPCLPCNVPQCANGIQDGDETDIDCGGSCTPCHIVYPPHCYNGLQDVNETGIDCGGLCPPCVTVYPPHCYNGKRDGNESATDCGGSCPPCTYTSGGGTNVGVNTGGNTEYYDKGTHTAFIQRLNEIYGQGYFTNDKYKVVQDFTAHRTTLDGGNSCAIQQYIINNSATQPNRVIYELTALSPNVSANTFHILFGHSQYYTSAQIADILILNPAVLSDRYISYILYKTATFSPAEKSQIVQSAISVSNRTDTETTLSFKKQYQDAIIRDNIAMLSLNTPFDFNGIRAEIATDPDPHKVFDIALTYADQGRHDLALAALTQADVCEITDPIYRSQWDGLITLYSNWSNVQANHEGSRNSIVQQLLSQEHGLATDLAADITNQPVKLKERWRYEPLTFLTPSYTKDVHAWSVDIYPNPAYDVLNIHIKGKNTGNDLVAAIINADGKVMVEFRIQKDSRYIDISALNSGVYTVKVTDVHDIVFVSKFIKIQ